MHACADSAVCGGVLRERALIHLLMVWLPTAATHMPVSALQFKMLRDIEGQQFSGAVRDKLGPRVALMGELLRCVDCSSTVHSTAVCRLSSSAALAA
jgi:hypothetical protein